MERDLKEKYNGFIYKYINSDTICLGGMMIKNGYDEKFFNDAVEDNILIEITDNKNNNNKGNCQRKFKFTDFAKKFLD